MNCQIFNIITARYVVREGNVFSRMYVCPSVCVRGGGPHATTMGLFKLAQSTALIVDPSSTWVPPLAPATPQTSSNLFTI